MSVGPQKADGVAAVRKSSAWCQFLTGAAAATTRPTCRRGRAFRGPSCVIGLGPAPACTPNLQLSEFRRKVGEIPARLARSCQDTGSNSWWHADYTRLDGFHRRRLEWRPGLKPELCWPSTSDRGASCPGVVMLFRWALSADPRTQATVANVGSAAQYRWRDRDIERLRRLQVCADLEITWFADRESARFCSLEDLVDERSAAAEQHRQVGSIAQQAASIRNLSEWRHDRDLIS